jgi:predicted NUDIX family NTP pyrophosphohydrolase
MYRRTPDGPQVLLVHPGGPYWRNKDAGAWSIPKGEMRHGEKPEDVARREFAEELGLALTGALEPLGEIRQASGKHVHAFAIEGDLDASMAKSNTFELEWPPNSGRMKTFPEIDRADWFGLAEARAKLLASQAPLLDRLARLLEGPGAAGPRD